jgi:hypothetical protein
MEIQHVARELADDTPKSAGSIGGVAHASH